MARAQNPNSANSQFFIMFDAGPLARRPVHRRRRGRRAAWNWSTSIKKGDDAQNGVVSDPDRMIKVRIAADAK